MHCFFLSHNKTGLQQITKSARLGTPFQMEFMRAGARELHT